MLVTIRSWSLLLVALTACGYCGTCGGGNSHEESKLHAGTAPVLSPQDITTFERDGVLVVPTRAANSGGAWGSCSWTQVGTQTRTPWILGHSRYVGNVPAYM
jgi:hypothetical protein